MRYLKIEWSNSSDLGNIYYSGGFVNRINLDVEISNPEYEVEIEAEKDGENRDIPTFKKWEKAYRFELWATEDLVDAFTLMQLHDTIAVTLQTGRQIAVDKMNVSVEWPEQGCLAKMAVTFTEDYIASTNCGETLDAGCLCETSVGDFLAIEAYPASGMGYTTGDMILGYSVENIAGKKYTAKLYIRTNQIGSGATFWIEQPTPLQFTCWENIEVGNEATWIFDGQFWQLFPGYIISLTQTASPANHTTVVAYIPPGCFGTVYYEDSILGWVDAGDYTDDQLAAGVVINPPQDGSTGFKIEVWNHSCNYGYTEIETIVLT